jgi:hypothetical protein
MYCSIAAFTAFIVIEDISSVVNILAVLLLRVAIACPAWLSSKGASAAAFAWA